MFSNQGRSTGLCTTISGFRVRVTCLLKDSGRGAEYTGSQRPTRASAFPILLKRRYAALLELWRSLDHTSVTTLAVCFPLTWLHILYQFHRSRYQPARHLNDTRHFFLRNNASIIGDPWRHRHLLVAWPHTWSAPGVASPPHCYLTCHARYDNAHWGGLSHDHHE